MLPSEYSMSAQSSLLCIIVKITFLTMTKITFLAAGDQDQDQVDVICDNDTYLENPLCVPHDRLEDIDFFPCFDDDLIRLPEEDLRFDEDFISNSPDGMECSEGGGYSIEKSSNYFEVDENEDSNLEASTTLDSGQICLQHNNYHDWKGDGGVPSDGIPRKARSKRLRPNQDRTFKSLWETPSKLPNQNRMLNSRLSSKRRRCFHCEAERTPQWRMGPTGPNTLCNACGLRYKIGRLMPQYRPAASPSFDSAKHSNFYKRILQSNLSQEQSPEYG